jgi:hypothetical protein
VRRLLVVRRARRILFLLLAAVVLAAIPTLAYGPLIPWSPIHPGYQELTLSRSRVLYPANSTLPEAYRHADTWIREAERFYDVPAAKRVNIILVRSWADFRRFAPWTYNEMLGGASLVTGDAIYITPRVNALKLDHAEFLRHEIAHSVLAQNAPAFSTYWAVQHLSWFSDGLAVWFGGYRTFGTQADYFNRARSGAIASDIVQSERVPDLRYGYVTWRNFVDYLDQTHGHASFLAFVHAANSDPKSVERLFRAHLGRSIQEASSAFETAVLSRSFTPR